MLEGYINAVREHTAECLDALDELSGMLSQRRLNRFEQKAAERYLQLLIEAAIGIAKHWVKQQKGFAHTEARTNFEYLVVKNLVDSSTHWRAIVGTRNVLVHDYLDVDPYRIEDIIQNRKYDQIAKFIHTGLVALQEADE